MSKISVTTLGDLIEFQRGYDLPKSSFVDGNVPVISSNGILGFHNEYKVKAPGITIGRSGTVGFPHYIEKDFFPHNTALFVKDFKGNNPKYIFYLLQTLGLNDRKTGSGVPTMNRNHLHPIKVTTYLDLESQQKIAAVLSSLDSKIELNNKINAELEAMAKMLYDYWFVQFDFPDKDGKPYKTSGGKMVWNDELKREIPEGWEVGVASDLFDFNPSLSLKMGVVASYIDMDALPTNGFMTKDVQQKEFNGGLKFQNGDVVIARITPCLENGKTGLITLFDNDEIGFGSTEFIVMRGKKRSLSCFAAFLSRSELFRKFAIANMIGTSGRKRVDSKMLESFSLALPDNEILEKFEKVIGSFFQKTSVNIKENQTLSELRDWLLPMLMNGQVKVT